MSSCAVTESEIVTIGIMSDMHYLSGKLTDGGNAHKNYERIAGRNISDISAILDKTLADFYDRKIDILLIPGDMTKDGEKQSHEEFILKLQPLIDAGVKIYVIPGNHDINVPNPIGFKENTTYKVENISASEFETIYSQCGYNDAIYKDTTSLSYVAELTVDTWLLAIDSNKHKEYTNQTITAGHIQPSTEQWITEVLSQAKQKNKKVIGLMHHGLIEHIIFQDLIFPQYLVDDWRRLASLFADNGVKFIFTGHFHSNDISEFESDKGNKLYDIETGALSVYPFSYRIAEMTNDALDIKTFRVTDVEANPDFWEDGRKHVKQWAKEIVKQKIRERNLKIASDAILEKIADLGSEIVILHLQGDEELNDDLILRIKEIAQEADLPIDLSPEYMQLDMPPSDNNVKLFFGK
ncbi:metallophosphoesterase [Dysgonomonas sp. 216]|nr:metallophosphoesterase [Dysgonomonas sp. 216]